MSARNPNDGMDFSITVLGSDGSYPGPGGAGSGYLVRAGGFFTWLEAGPGTLANLQLHVSLDRLGAVVVSHCHADHRSDLESLYVALRYFLNRRGLPLYAPEEVQGFMHKEHFDGTFDWRVVSDGTSAELGPARWTWRRTDHPVETMAARVQLDGRALGYSADTGPAWELSELGEGLTLALVEASLPASEAGTIQHLTARQAGATAARAGAKRLLLTHIAPHLDKTRAREEAEEAFAAPVEVARMGGTWQI
ncbi:MAG: MBL fold metallo-hydrolase [Actinobacteria bacterium]|nr:MBL fold metallo-hydrolase [Actinomycetota bacterium]